MGLISSEEPLKVETCAPAELREEEDTVSVKGLSGAECRLGGHGKGLQSNSGS